MLPQRVLRRRLREAQRRRDAEDEGGRDRRDRGEEENRRIEADLVQPWQVAAAEIAKERHAERRQREPESAATGSEDQAFDEQLPDEPGPARTER